MQKRYSQIETIELMNKLGQENRPFLFVISYNTGENLLFPLNEIDSSEIRFDFSDKQPETFNPPQLKPQKVDFENYLKGFSIVKENLLKGNSFLTNLTVSTPLKNELDLHAVFLQTKAKYKLWIKDTLVCFSPETFVNVNPNGEIATFPMKGTIDALLPDAETKLKSDKKELYEHTTIVDLLRNDLSMVATDIRVERFQYIERIKKNDGAEIFQMSSEIKGQLPNNWKNTLGSWFLKLLPAGSICGAPKEKTLEIINEAEKQLHQNGERGFYTGVFGIFDGTSLTSAVMIRFIEQTDTEFVFKSGGGITHLSVAEQEYNEIYQKLYIPVG